MTDDLYAKALMDYVFTSFIMTLVEMSKGNPITLETVLAKAQEAKDHLQGDGPVSAVTMRDVPEGVQGVYRSDVGAVHDRGLELFQVLLAL